MSGGPAPVLVLENVWGPAFDDLAAEIAVRREPALPGGELTGVRALVVRNRTQVGAELLAASPHLQVIARAGVGLDNIDLGAASARDIPVIAPLGANARAVAELTVGLAIDLLRGITRLDRSVRGGGWERVPGRELADRTWGVLGAGATGRAVAGLAAAFGMSVIGYDPYAPADCGVALVGLDELLGRADVVSMHLPATPETRGLLDAAAFARMRAGAVLVNVGRGDALDEAALIDALRDGRPAGAALDVRALEPPAAGTLENLDNVVLTPHIAGLTAESQERITDVLVADIRRVLDGQAPRSAVGR